MICEIGIYKLNLLKISNGNEKFNFRYIKKSLT